MKLKRFQIPKGHTVRETAVFPKTMLNGACFPENGALFTDTMMFGIKNKEYGEWARRFHYGLYENDVKNCEHVWIKALAPRMSA